MTRLVLIGLWVCVVTLVSAYGVASWSSSQAKKKEEAPYLEGLEFRKLRLINVPIVADNAVKGYVVAQFVYTADARTLREISIPPEPLIIDRAFRLIYDDTDRKFDGVNKKDLNKLTGAIKVEVNKMFGADIVSDILIEEFNYIDRKEILD
ncbi:flagellar basal body-associated protein FliL [Pseudochelatococcus lubricantis]|uniref:Flagellar basal body-associated protein FliL n=1 Tax=Pseudochelatococcus lubricantis TaxID=1538102 RepID=A0ABX0UZ39_9HYPH|nr:hypothetical protein [Pseudochelatococcus lubricantis]NIJ57129.1 flagellar basal body-associated protein FliL [Pseudochelatococcus lubricantis]